MEKLEKKLGKLWRRVRRKKSKASKEAENKQDPLQFPPSASASPQPSETVVLRKNTSSTSRPRSYQGAEISNKLKRNGSKLSRQGSNRSSVKAQSEEPFMSSDEEGQRINIRKPIVRRRSSKKSAKVPHTNIAMFNLYYLANLYKLRGTILRPSQKQHNTITLAITIPEDDFFSELGSDTFSKHPHISSLPKHSKRQPSREFDKESYAESSGYESGYMSNIELAVRDCLSESDHSIFSFALLSPINRKKIRMAPNIYNQRSLESLNIKQLSPVTLPKSITLTKLSRAPRDLTDTFLRRSIFKTKFITTVFEATNTGIEDLLEDVQNELNMWFGKKMIGVACELHWSVPEKHRNRTLEAKMKEAIHLSLRINNRRLLYLRGPKGALPLRLAEGTTKENCFRNKKMDTFEGVYQRCYSNLLPYFHEETPIWHAPYWTLESGRLLNVGQVLRPRPSEFLFGNKSSSLQTTTLLALNIAALQIRSICH